MCKSGLEIYKENEKKCLPCSESISNCFKCESTDSNVKCLECENYYKLNEQFECIKVTDDEI